MDQRVHDRRTPFLIVHMIVHTSTHHHSPGEMKCDYVNTSNGRIFHTIFKDLARKGVTHFLTTRLPGYLAIKKKKTRSHDSQIVPFAKWEYDRTRGGVDFATQFLHKLNLYRIERKWTLNVAMMVLGLSVLDVMLIMHQQNPHQRRCEQMTFAMRLGINLCHFEDAGG